MSQKIIKNADGRITIENDWFHGELPAGIVLEEYSYADTSYSFTKFHSQKKDSFVLGFGSGNYGHSSFIGGSDAQIIIGRFVVLQGMNIICNKSVSIGDHCMFSWGSIITDSWLDEKITIDQRRKILNSAAMTADRNVDFANPSPVVIEENVWVGFKAIILPGVRLGRGCVIGSNSVIDRDVPPYAVVAGHPGKIIRFLDQTDTPESKALVMKKFSVEQ